VDGWDDAVKLTWTDAVSGVTYTQGAAVANGEVQTCASIDAANSECFKGNLIDPDYGWVCRDIPDTEEGATAWTVAATNPNLGN
jgi:hypothetical protein